MKIGFFEIEDWEEKFIREHFPDDEITFSKNKIDSANIPDKKDYEILSVFIDSSLDRQTLSQFPNLKFITTRSTGFDHIDISFCKEKNITVSIVPDYGARTVAEYTFGLILNLTRKMFRAIDQVKERELFSLINLRGMDLKDKTLGVVGVGRIGREVIKIAKGFEMKVIATAPKPDNALADELGFSYVSLQDLLKNSDIITIHCPYNQSTHHLINKGNSGLIKKGAYLVNTARGGIVETEALVAMLKDGTLSGAGLDVLEEEGGMKDELELLSKKNLSEEKLKTALYGHILINMPNVLITPHNAFNSKEALERILTATIGNIQGFINGRPINLAQ